MGTLTAFVELKDRIEESYRVARRVARAKDFDHARTEIALSAIWLDEMAEVLANQPFTHSQSWTNRAIWLAAARRWFKELEAAISAVEEQSA